MQTTGKGLALMDTIKPLGRKDAERFLRARYKDQCWQYPMLREQVSEETYVRRNLARAAKLDAETAWATVGKDF